MPKEFTLTILLGNDAMQTGDDIAEALRLTAARIENYDGPEYEGSIRDENGNTVGSYQVIET